MVETVLNLESLYDQIRNLSPSDRDQLLSNIQHDSKKETTSSAMNTDEVIVFTALMDACRSNMPYSRLFETYGRKHFDDKVHIVLGFIESYRKLLRRPQVQGLATMCLKCLVKHMQSREIPVTVKTVLDSLELMPHAVNKAYPGYADAGMLHRLVDARRAA